MSLRAIAWWQIIGGSLLVIANLMGLIANRPGLPAPSILYLLTSLALAALAIRGGVLLRTGSPRGIRLALVTQLLQVAWVSLPGAAFGSTLGPTIGPRLTATSIRFQVGFYGRGGVWILPSDSRVRFPFDVSLNLLAVGAIVFLAREYRRRNVSVTALPVAAA